jgi:hypothetical protein
MILLKSIILSSAEFKDITSNLRQIIEINQSSIQLGNVSSAISNMSNIDAERISNFFQFLRLNSNE